MDQRTIGILGGMSWHSTATYYELVNGMIADALGGHHSARVLLDSVDFAEYRELQCAGNWARIGELLSDHARRLEAAGADMIVLATNTMHLVADEIASAVTIPFVHIADAIAADAKAQQAKRVGLLGTAYTMSEPFLVDALAARGIEAVPPPAERHAELNRIIFDELVHGEVREDSRAIYMQAIDDLQRAGCDAVVLACTEIAMLIRSIDPTPVPCIDTTRAHAKLAVARSLAPTPVN